MGERVRWIEHKGVRILHVDYSGLQDETAYLQVTDEFERVVLSQPPGKMVPALVDVTNSIPSPTVTQRNKAIAQKAREKGIPDSPTAMVGLSGFKLAVVQSLSFFRPDLYVAKDMEAAKGWLVAQKANP